jgi:hypothetical protein
MVGAEICAGSLEEALEHSKTMKEKDFVDIHGDYIDGRFSITGIYESSAEGL